MMSQINLDLMDVPVIAIEFVCITYGIIVVVGDGNVIYQGKP
jgi:hypothetical protein